MEELHDKKQKLDREKSQTTLLCRVPKKSKGPRQVDRLAKEKRGEP